MNFTVLLIAAYLPILPVLFMILRSGAFGRGSAGAFLKLLFLGVAAAVPAFLMEAGGFLAVSILMRVLFPDAMGSGVPVISAVLRYMAAAAVIEEGWKHFVLRASTWKQMTMDRIGDGAAASAAVGTGFAAVMFIAWQAAYRVIPADMEVLRAAMPDFLFAGTVISFIHALLFIPAHLGFSGFMGVLYGLAKGAEQKQHSGRAGFMLCISCLLPMLVHGLCAGMIGYGISSGKILWTVLGFAAEGVLALILAVVLGGARDAALAASAASAAAAAASAGREDLHVQIKTGMEEAEMADGPDSRADETGQGPEEGIFAEEEGADSGVDLPSDENPAAPDMDMDTGFAEAGSIDMQGQPELYFGESGDGNGRTEE